MAQSEEPGLGELIQRGGALYQVRGNSPREVLARITAAVSLSPSVDRDKLLEAVLEREALMSTAIGQGIALPHPRNPVITGPEEQFAVLAFLASPVDWKALDGKPVHTALLIVSASAKLHLHTLSRINFFCQQESFRELLERRADLEEIIKTIREAEDAWQ
jgi:PTS system nitrogen regulatory IIA component